jgi:hypothetical protein
MYSRLSLEAVEAMVAEQRRDAERRRHLRYYALPRRRYRRARAKAE